MNRYPIFFRWLVWAALIDWLVGRSLTRSAIFMPKSPVILLIYQFLGTLGQLAATGTALLALAALGWLAWTNLRAGRSLVLPFALASIASLSLVFLFVPPAGTLLLIYYVNMILAIGSLGWQALQARMELAKRTAAALVALALLTSAVYLIGPALFGVLRLPGPAEFSGDVFNLGEMLVLLAGVSLWWAYGRPASRRAWLLSAIPAGGFTAIHLVNPAIAGVISIWSTGLSLYLPWPFYTLTIWLAALVGINSFERRDPAGWAILLLAAGGYTPQLTSHAFLGIAALSLLLPTAETSSEHTRPRTERAARKIQAL
jgi:hypothetical protein